MLHRLRFALPAPALALALSVSLAGADPSPVPSGSSGAPAPGAPPAASALPGEGFVLLGEDKGVKVYRRKKRPGIELAAEGDIPAAPDRVRRILIDYPNHRRWQQHLKTNRILARGDSDLYVYQRLDLPIIHDRDFTLHVTWGNDAGVAWMRFATANERGPAPVPGVVRVTRHEGSWRLEPADGGKATHAVYRFYLDLGGSFPAWMGTGQATIDLPDLFVSIQRQLPRYP